MQLKSYNIAFVDAINGISATKNHCDKWHGFSLKDRLFIVHIIRSCNVNFLFKPYLNHLNSCFNVSVLSSWIEF